MSNVTADRWGKWLAIGGSLLAILAVVMAVNIMGSPMTQRKVRIDENRASDLNKLKLATNEWKTEHKALPATLAEVANQPGSDLRLRDPETQVPYEYERINADAYRLCAVFATDTARYKPDDWSLRIDWTHGVRRTCFTTDLGKQETPATAADLKDLKHATLR